MPAAIVATSVQLGLTAGAVLLTPMVFVRHIPPGPGIAVATVAGGGWVVATVWSARSATVLKQAGARVTVAPLLMMSAPVLVGAALLQSSGTAAPLLLTGGLLLLAPGVQTLANGVAFGKLRGERLTVAALPTRGGAELRLSARW